jgi:hypothetical protein
MKFESLPGKLPQLEMKHFWNPKYSISNTIVMVTEMYGGSYVLGKNLCLRIFQEIYQSWNSNILKIDRSNCHLTKRRIITSALLLNITI